MREPVTAPLRELAARMRAAGARVGMGELLGAHRALAAVDPADAFFALRAALCSSRADQAVFARAFRDTFGAGAVPPAPDLGALPAHAGAPARRGEAGGDRPPAREDPSSPFGGPRLLPSGGDLGPTGGEAVAATWSAVELLRAKDFAAYTDAERTLAHRLLAQLARRGPTRASRRTRPTRRRGEVHDLRATVRASLRHGGELLERRWRDPTQRPRRLVLVCDISGSMAPYARVLLQYAQAWVAARTSAEAFVFGTRLTRVTRELAGRDPDQALARASAHVADWSGGTRIGAALAALNREHGRRVGRGALVVILSDGWDRGDPDQLALEMARLRRCAHRVVWLNPLAADPRYEPLTRGMRAALPHIDRLLPGNSIASLEALAKLMEEGIA